MKNHWLTSMCPSCTMIGQVFLMQNAPRAKKSHFIKNILILSKLLSLEPYEQVELHRPFRNYACDNPVQDVRRVWDYSKAFFVTPHDRDKRERP